MPTFAHPSDTVLDPKLDGDALNHYSYPLAHLLIASGAPPHQPHSRIIKFLIIGALLQERTIAVPRRINSTSPSTSIR
jgi:hypothetical protein